MMSRGVLGSRHGENCGPAGGASCYNETPVSLVSSLRDYAIEAWMKQWTCFTSDILVRLAGFSQRVAANHVEKLPLAPAPGPAAGRKKNLSGEGGGAREPKRPRKVAPPASVALPVRASTRSDAALPMDMDAADPLAPVDAPTAMDPVAPLALSPKDSMCARTGVQGPLALAKDFIDIFVGINDYGDFVDKDGQVLPHPRQHRCSQPYAPPRPPV